MHYRCKDVTIGSDRISVSNLAGATAALRIKIGASLPPTERDKYEHQVLRLRESLAPSVAASVWAQGSHMDLVQAVAYAVETAAPAC
jgi:hypothetical protein